MIWGFWALGECFSYVASPFFKNSPRSKSATAIGVTGTSPIRLPPMVKVQEYIDKSRLYFRQLPKLGNPDYTSKISTAYPCLCTFMYQIGENEGVRPKASGQTKHKLADYRLEEKEGFARDVRRPCAGFYDKIRQQQ